MNLVKQNSWGSKLLILGLALLLVLGLFIGYTFATQNAEGDPVNLIDTSPSGFTELEVGATVTNMVANINEIDSSDISIATVEHTTGAFGMTAVLTRAGDGANLGPVSALVGSGEGNVQVFTYHVVDSRNIVTYTLPINAQLTLGRNLQNQALAGVAAANDNGADARNQIYWTSMNEAVVTVNNGTAGDVPTINTLDVNDSALLVGTFTDMWGVDHAVSVLINVGTRGANVTDLGTPAGNAILVCDEDDIFMATHPDGRPILPVTFWQVSPPEPAEQVWPCPTNPGEWVTDNPAGCLDCGSHLAEIARLVSELAEAEERIVILEGQVTTLQTEITRLETEVTRLEGEIDQLEGDVTYLEGRVEYLETEITRLKTEVEHLEGQVTYRDNTIYILEQEIAYLSDTIYVLVNAECDNPLCEVGNIRVYTLPGRGSRYLIGTGQNDATLGDIYVLLDNNGNVVLPLEYFAIPGGTRVYPDGDGWTTTEPPQMFIASFNTVGGNTIAPQAVNAGAQVIPPQDPERQGYRFVRWEPAITTTITRATTFVAVWEQGSGSPVTGINPGGTFVYNGVTWRVLDNDNLHPGYALIITEHVHHVGTIFHSNTSTVANNMSQYFPWANMMAQTNAAHISPIRGAMDTFWTHNVAGTTLADAAVQAVGLNRDVRTTHGNWNAGENSANGWTSPGVGTSVTSRNSLFILSVSEVNRYFSATTGANGRQAQTPAQFAANPNSPATADNTPWWLRSPGSSAAHPCSDVSTSGNVGNATASLASRGLRPALWIAL